MHCGACGTRLQETDRFCTACGQAIAPVAEPAGQVTRTSLDTAIHVSQLVTAAPSARAPSSSSGWLTSSDSIDHGRFAPGSVLEDRYRIIGLLGRGGMGEVYRADDLRLGQPVALKFLPQTLRDDPVRLAQFHNEVRTARQVSHPNICRVYDIGEAAGHLYLTMEYVDGEDLASSLRRIGRFPDDKALEIARQLCAGLAAAHERGVLHRDLKPANVMLDGAGKVRLMDFGLAAVGPVADVRAGTPAYMAPEQLLGREVTARSDIFALGLVLYELFTGRRAFSATTVGELVSQHESRSTPPPSSLVSSLDPAIERAILRCLEPDASRRPTSPLAVAAALPGGDPLAAALAAGETPSPEMVAAAGEGVGLARPLAIGVYVALLAGIGAGSLLALQSSALEMLRPEFPTAVMAQKARDAIARLGYAERPRDDAFGYTWNGSLVDHIRRSSKTSPDWSRALHEWPSPLQFWYRSSPAPMTGLMFHSDLLTPGIVDQEDPPPILGGMIQIQLDHLGRLLFFEAMPAQVQDQAPPRTEVDWSPLLSLAGLDAGKLNTTTPRWNWLAASDTRAAWTGTWPGTNRELRVEAAALGGRPVAFLLTGPWLRPWRMPQGAEDDDTIPLLLLSVLALSILVGAVWMARQNLRDGRGDRHSALSLAIVTIAASLGLWVFNTHVVPSLGLLATFLLAICTSVFNGVLLWTIYIALEPVVRRRWPQALVSWTTLFAGRFRDPIVGRDVLFGLALGVAWVLLLRGIGLVVRTDDPYVSVELLGGFRSTIGELVTQAFRAVRTALVFFMLLFMWRLLLRRQWLAAIAFAATFAALDAVAANGWTVVVTSFAVSLMAALVAVRWGLVSLTVGVLTTNLLLRIPISRDLSAWYASTLLLVIAITVVLATWAFVTAMGGGARVRKAVGWH
jgi:serine/threonine-protein kinase